MPRPEPPTWSDLAAFLKTVALLFGQPSEILESQALERPAARALRAWLSTLEAIARALLLLAALAMPAPVIRKRTTEARTRSPIDPPADDNPADSSTWAGVAFRLLPPERRESAGGAAARYRFVPAKPLAFRFEALIRVSEAPDRYARRLARLLADGRLGPEAPLTRRLLRRPELPAPPRPARDMLGEALGQAGAALTAPAADSG